MAVARVDTPDKVAANSIGAVVNKLEDMLRGVERLRAAIAIVGQARYSQLCQELNFASDHLDDIPDREALRKQSRPWKLKLLQDCEWEIECEWRDRFQ
jgi:hypothetical protein